MKKATKGPKTGKERYAGRDTRKRPERRVTRETSEKRDRQTERRTKRAEPGL